MSERTVYVKVGAKVDGAVAGIKKVGASLNDLTKADLKSPQKAFDGISSKAALMGAGVAFGITKAVSSFANFDSAVSAASAALPDAGAKMNDLRELAIQMGKDTQFSATEAAQGITEMAKAGVEAEDILEGGLKGALDLAAAGQLEVARASEIAGIAVKQFNLQGRDVPHVADLYAAAAGKATGSVEDIAQAMKFAGVTANSMGISLEETTGTLGLFASKGIIGEQAGTSFRSMLLSLTAPSKLAKATLDEYNISLFDAAGNFIGIEGAAEQLRQKLGPLDEATRTAALGQIFGNESIGAAIALYEAGGSGVADWTAKVNDAGFASEQAAKLTDNLKGDLERLGGTIETTFITGGSSANGALRTLTQGLEGVIEKVGNVPGPALLAGAALTGISLGLPKGLSAYRELKGSLDSLGISMDRIHAKAPRAAKAIGLVGKAAGTFAAVATVSGLTSGSSSDLGIEQTINALDDAAVSVATLNARMATLTDNGFGNAESNVKSFGDVIRFTFEPGLWDRANDMSGTLLSTFGGSNTADIAVASQRLGEIDQVLSQLVSSGRGDAAAKLFGELQGQVLASGRSADEAKALFPGYAEAVARAGNQSKTAAPKIGEASAEVQGIKEAAEAAATKLDGLSDSILGFGSPLAEQRANARGFRDAVDGAKDALAAQVEELTAARLETLGITDATKKQTEAAKAWAKAQIKAGAGLDITTEAGRNNQDALDGIRSKTLDNVVSTFKLTGSMGEARKAMQQGRDAFIDAATAAGLSAPKAKELADNLGLIPRDVETQIALSGVPTANTKIDGITGKLTNLDKAKAEPSVKAKIDGATFSHAEHRLDVLARDRFATLTVRLRDYTTGLGLSGANRRINAATGGPIFGPGTGTSDSVPAMLSNGEHVLTAAEVAAAGGHGEIFKLRKAILTSGIAMRATGGPAGGFSAPVSSFRAAPAAPPSGFTLAELVKAVGSAAPTTVQVLGANVDEAGLAATIDWRKRRAR